jgi:hypothetical protein
MAGLLAWGVAGRVAEGPARAQENSKRTPVIVELFTSEGCSSCPPADLLLAKLEREQPIAGTEVIALEEHVDYWNTPGWMDPFSSAEYTARQNVYEGKLGGGSAYTPQAIIDGGAQLVGSQEGALRDSIQRGTAGAKAVVSVTGGGSGAGANTFDVSVGKVTAAKGDTAEVWLAVTEAGLHSDVKGGENAGEDVHHASIVRSLRKIAVAGAGDVAYRASQTVKVDKRWKAENLRVVAFVQEKKSRRILGGAVARFGG